MLALPGLLPFLAMAAPAATAAPTQETVVVTATRLPRAGFALPAAVDVVPRRLVREDNPQVNLSEALVRVPGIAVANRQNHAQDLQVSSRGFGARASFGVRGVRLVADGIPATMPDGQGQAATFDLASAGRIEVLRGPFAALHGNSSGGVVHIFTADGPAQPTLDARLAAGSHGQRRASARFGGEPAGINVLVGASRFETDGLRQHSAAVREQLNAKVRVPLPAGRLTFVVNAIDQPGSQDPLGLTRAQFEADPRQADAAAFLFDTRKSVRQAQAGAAYEVALGPADALEARLYAGDRQVEQFLAMAGDAPLASGGVVDLDRGYGGAGVRWTRRFGGERPFTLSLGADGDRMKERRRGFVNELGTRGPLRRDEDDIVASTGAYAIGEWDFAPRWQLAGGVRHSRVRFEARDFRVTPANPDDSGSVAYSRTTPAAGVAFEASPGIRLFASAGGGFETPTFAELAYRPGGATGPNFALRPARIRQGEAGVKVRAGTFRADVAAFRIETRDEIVPNSASGGRTDFRNAAATLRRGVEVSAHADLGAGLSASLAYTHVDARFREGFTAGTPAIPIPAGRRLPGVARNLAFAELAWRHSSGWHAAIEARYSGDIPVDDANSDAAPAYWVAAARVGHAWRVGPWNVKAFARVDNVGDRRYAGSVIVAEARGRHFEPAPGRTVFAGLEVGRVF